MYCIRLSTLRMRTCAALNGAVDSTVSGRAAVPGRGAACTVVGVAEVQPPIPWTTYAAVRLPATAMAESSTWRAAGGRRGELEAPIIKPPRNT